MDLLDISKRREVPRFNQDIVNGLAYKYMPQAISYVSSLIRGIMSECAPEGLEFHGMAMTDPKLEISASVISKQSKRLRYDQSNLYMCSLNFTYKGKEVRPPKIRLPYVLRGGELLMDGKTFFIYPVLSDRGVNLRSNRMYVFINRGNYNFSRVGYNLLENNLLISENFIWARMHQENEKAAAAKRDKGIGKLNMDPSIFMYLLLNKGATKAMVDYFGVTPIFKKGTYEEVLTQYPKDKYNIYSSGGKKPTKVNKLRWETPSLHLVFSVDDKPIQRELASNFMYIYDHFTTRIFPEMLEDTESWKVIAGHMIFNYPVADAKLAEAVDRHLDRSLHHLLDYTTIQELHLDQILVNDIYELFAWLITNEKDIFLNKDPASMNDKRLTLLRYTLGPITKAITKLSYALMNAKDNPPNHANMEKLLNTHIREGLIRSITSQNGEVNSEQCSSDNMYLSVTRRIIPQSKNLRRGSPDKGKMYKPENFIHSSIMTVGQIDGQNGPLH